MAFTYDDSLGDPRSRVRFEVGDTDESTPLFSDTEIDAVLADNGDEPLAAAAALCEQLAARFARDFDVDVDGQSMKRSQRAAAYERRAASLRSRSTRAGGISTIEVTRVDAVSDDLSARDASRTERDDRDCGPPW